MPEKVERPPALGQALNCETWGVELSPDRAEKAQQVMDKVYQAPWQSCFLSDESVSWLYLNPPYSDDRFADHPAQSSEASKQLEWDFLKTTTSKLMRGGLLTYVVPQKILGIIQVARWLAGHYEALSVYSFPDGLFEKFKQVVVLAYKRRIFHIPTDKEVLSLQTLATTALDPFQPSVEPVYELLPATTRGANEAGRLQTHGLGTGGSGRSHGYSRCPYDQSEWQDLIYQTRNLAQLTQPVMPLKRGHIAMMMASGMMGTVHLR